VPLGVWEVVLHDLERAGHASLTEVAQASDRETVDLAGSVW
jgi:hypothetical protein